MLSDSTQGRYRMRLVSALVLIALAACALATADVFLSVQSGAWTDATTWINASADPDAVPGAFDDVIVAHDVGALAQGEAGTVEIVAQSIWITPTGTLRARHPAVSYGENLVVTTTYFADFSSFDPDRPVDPNALPDPGSIDIMTYVPVASLYNQGRILGQDGGWAGGSVLIRTEWPPASAPTPGLLINVREILGGRGMRYGGNVVVLYPDGVAVNFGYPGVLRAADGSAFGGQALLIAAQAYNGVPLAGGPIPGVLLAGNAGGGSGGAAFVAALSAGYPRVARAYNALESVVGAGEGRTTAGTHFGGGHAGVLALEPSGIGLAVNEPAAQILGGRGCPGGDAWLFGDLTVNRGIVAAGETLCDPARTRIDPSAGVIEDLARITGNVIELSASELTIGPLLWGPEPPIEATDRIEITVQDTLDLSNMAGGAPCLWAGAEIVIHADQVLIPGPLGPEPAIAAEDLSGFMSPTPDWVPLSGRVYRQLFAGTNALYRVNPGESIELQALFANLGGQAENVEYYVVCNRDGWMSDWLGDPALPLAATLQPIDGLMERVRIDVPADADPFNRTRLSLHIEATDDPNLAEDATIELVVLACLGRGDLDGNGEVNLTDLAIMLADFGCNSNCVGDITGDDATTLADLAILLSEFGCGA